MHLYALPGASEHQTGLGIDMSSESVNEGKRLVFGDTSEYKWACKNAHKYGFVLRFADGTSEDYRYYTGTLAFPLCR